jgi:ribosome-associated protein
MGEVVTIELREDHIELCKLLKLAGVADSGSQGKQMVADGLVTVDGRPESRKAAKIRAGQAVACLGTRIEVLARATGKD